MYARKMMREQRCIFLGTRSAARTAETKNKSERRGVSKNEERKEGRGKDQKKAKDFITTQLRTQLVNFAFNFSLYVRSTDLCAVSMTCDLHAEQRKRDSGKKYERREEQRIRAET
jgi:hypothetical protein